MAKASGSDAMKQSLFYVWLNSPFVLALVGAILFPAVVQSAALLFQTHQRCVQDADKISEQYPRLVYEYFFRRRYIVQSIVDARTVDDIHRSFEKIPDLYVETRGRPLTDQSFDFKRVSDRIDFGKVSSLKRWRALDDNPDTFHFVQFGIFQSHITEADLPTLKEWARRLAENDAKNEREEQKFELASLCTYHLAFRLLFVDPNAKIVEARLVK